jgi:isoleucyl-tRNA synthetase
MDIKSTLNLPRTDFPMKASLPKVEPVQLEQWESQHLYAEIQKARAGAPSYVLHDGPPYPTGAIHLGTALNKILKDMVVKSKTMAGFRSPYVPGWDCHGLPIETKVEKELGHKGAVSPAEFRMKCREFALYFVDQHRRDFKRLGVFGQWDNPYLTMSHEYEACIADAFLTFLERGYIYRGLKPVYWCLTDSTALAEAEVEYENHTSPSIWVKFPVVGAAAASKLGPNVDAVIWTTTPWTLPHNRALAFHPDFDYIVAETLHGALLVAEERVAALKDEIGIESTAFRGPWKGRELEGLQFQHPFLNDLRVPAVLADYVTLDTGTGIVHTAPGHGMEDFQTGQRYGLETYAPLDDQGRYVEGLPEYIGKTVFEANPIIIALLRDRKMLLGEGKLTHSYPHCWRCHNPVIFRATEQWFIKLDASRKGSEAPTLRARALDEVKKVRWLPAWGEDRMSSMVAERPDWCVSRQRFWGVPIPVFYCDECGKPFTDVSALRNVIEWFKREGADAWYLHSPEELLPAGTKCSCGAANWRKENDILDVWFDSGSSSLAVLGRDGLPWPADMYLEGPDQFRGWFQSSLLIGSAIKEAAPYRNVLTYGWAVDEQGDPMSKSRGNVIFPRDICDKWGADLLRLWVASQDYSTDMRLSDDVMKQLAEAYRKIRNTFRFALSNLFDFDPSRDAVPDAQLEEFDAWMLHRTAALAAECSVWYENFEFHRVYHAVHDFITVDLSAFYFDILKDRLYTFAASGRPRRSAQTAMWRIADALLRIVAPILVFTSEEIWKHFPKPLGQPQSVHMAEFSVAKSIATEVAPEVWANWEQLLGLRRDVLSALETARSTKLISGSLEAMVSIEPRATLSPEQKTELNSLLSSYAKWLPALFIVSQVHSGLPGKECPGAVTENSPGGSPWIVRVERADGKKCERCWNYSTHVGESSKFPTVCERCLPVVESILGGSVVAS